MKLKIKPEFFTQNFSKFNLFKLLYNSKFFLNFFRTKKRSILFNKDWTERWKKKLTDDLLNKKDWRGLPLDSDLSTDKFYSRLYDFTALKKIFQILSEEKDSILDIGAYTNMYLQYYKNFNKIILSDTNSKAKNNKYPFFLLNGYDLKNIPNNSVDVIFSMETLIRVDKKILYNYFSDFNRILKPKGIILCHVPNIFHHMSYKKIFTFVSSIFYYKILNKHFNFYFENNLMFNSSFLVAEKKGTGASSKIFIFNQ